MVEEIRITRYGKTHQLFRGELLAEVADRHWPGQGHRQLDIRVYRTETGGYLLTSCFRVSYPERREFTGATHFNSAADIHDFLSGEAKGLEEDVDSLITQAAEKDEAFRLLAWGRGCLNHPPLLGENGAHSHVL